MSDRILGAACLAVSAAMAWAAKDYAAAISYEPVGPRAFPLLLACGLALSGLWLMLRPHLGLSSFQGVPWARTSACAGAILGYALLFQTMGFPLATALMAVPVGTAFGGNWKHALVGGLGLGLGFFLIFDKLFDVVMPAGPLAPLLGVN